MTTNEYDRSHDFFTDGTIDPETQAARIRHEADQQRLQWQGKTDEMPTQVFVTCACGRTRLAKFASLVCCYQAKTERERNS